MKRQSKAEEALNGQLKEVRAQIDFELAAMEAQKIKVATLSRVAEALAGEIDKLKQARLKASEERRPR